VIIENMGPAINTRFHDYSPIISGDGSTLIFTSNRSDDERAIKEGSNYEDIFICRKEGSTWSAPKKISSNINQKYNDAAASLSPDGKTAYIDSDREGGLGERDIWTVDMTEMMPKPHTGPYMSLLTGSIFNVDGKPVVADLKFFDASGTQVGSTSSSAEGNYQIQLEGDKTYEVRIEMPGYKAIKESIKLDADKDGAMFELVKHFILYKE